ncbi:MAG: Hsp70 family protein, partial [Deltaproteobacteria bacterium]|nr:Hsp70 family protein [Deltaproteobacteria bacterium]
MRELTARDTGAPRFIVGIDLGTTHTVVAYAEREDPRAPILLFEVAQLVAPGEVARRALLPSLRYHPAPGELSPADLRLPWTTAEGSAGESPAVVGELARALGAKVPGRLVASAKSWLSHPAVDRTAPILPWGAAEGIPRVSPVAASASYLRHLREAWNHAFPEDPLEAQELVLTVPASFDDAARSLTVEAARQAGLARVRLLEEPQAALYDWLHRCGDGLEEALGGARLLLVCDVGGGTTDLSLIQVRRTPAGPRLERIGVGDHLMLGGDNMDLALAHLAERRVDGSERLGAASFSQLVQQCRGAKERFLGPQAPERTTVTVLGSGSRLIGGARSAELSREDVAALVLEGFFPAAALDERPRKVRSGLVEFGLPYAADPAVTRHLAAFLAAHAEASRAALAEAGVEPEDPIPEAVLLNGGVFRSS